MDKSSAKLLHNFILVKKDVKEILLCLMSLLTLGFMLWGLNAYRLHLIKLESQIEILEKKAALQNKQQTKKALHLKLMQNSSSNFLENQLGRLELLSQELENTRFLNYRYPKNEFLQHRLAFLETNKNLLFIAQRERFNKELGIKEIEFSMKRPVQVDDKDLQKIILLIENPYLLENRPFIMIKKLDLTRSLEKSGENMYQLELELVEKIPYSEDLCQ